MPTLPLNGLKVIEFPSGTAGAYCGRLFHQYGADVIRMHYPSPVASIDLDKDEQYLNEGKIALNHSCNSKDDEEALDALLLGCNILIHSSEMTPHPRPNWLERENPDLISLSITDLGLSGPWSNMQSTDLILQAASGLMSLNKSTNGTPLKIPGNQSYYHAGAYAYSIAIASLLTQNSNGIGRSIEVSVLESILPIIAPELVHSTCTDLPDEKLITSNNQMIACKNGEVVISSREESSIQILEAVFNIKILDACQKPYEPTFKIIGLQNQILKDCFQNFTMKEIFNKLAPLGILVGMNLSISDLYGNEHLVSREVFKNPSTSEVMKKLIPGLPFRLLPSTKKDHFPKNHVEKNSKVNFHDSVNSIKTLDRQPSGSLTASDDYSHVYPLKKFRVIALTHTWSGALTTQLLGALGAEIIQIESPTRPDLWRGPLENILIDDYPDKSFTEEPYNQYYKFHSANQNKLGITLNLESSKGREELLNLVKISDIVVENFSPRVMRNLNLEFNSLRCFNPTLIMLRMPGYGISGDYSLFPANGSCIEPMTGISSLLNYSPTISSIMHTDVIAGNLGLAAVLTALYERSISGNGQLIDLSQQETALSFIGDILANQTPRNSHDKLIENGSYKMAPHGVFKCRGENAWIALSIRDDNEWELFCEVTQNPEWADVNEYSTSKKRLDNQTLLHNLISEWSKSLDVDELVEKLQSGSLPAIKIASINQLDENIHLAKRQALETIHLNETKDYTMVTTPFIIDGHRIRNSKPVPKFGEHNDHIFKNLLGNNQEKLESLKIDAITGNHVT